MYQPSFDESLQLPTAARLLHPNIKRALGVLDSRLEEELKRYRCYRTGQPLDPSAVRAGQKMSYREMQAFGVMPVSAAPPSSQPPVAPVSSETQDALQAAAASSLALVSRRGDRTEQQGLAPFLSEGEIPDNYLASSEQLLYSLAEEDAGPEVNSSGAKSVLTPLSVGSMLLMLLGSGMFGYLVMNPSRLQLALGWGESVLDRVSRGYHSYVATWAPQADRGDAKGSTNRAEDPGTWVSSAPALDRQEFLNLSLDNFSALQTRPAMNLSLFPQPTPSSSANAIPSQSSPLQQLAPSPSPLASLAPTPLATPSASSLSVAASASSGMGAALPPLRQPVQSQPRSQPRPSYSSPPSWIDSASSSRTPAFQPTPAPAPSPTKSYELPQNPPPVSVPIPPAEPTPTPQGSYSVVAPYTNDRALESAQQASPDASFRNLDDGAYIKFGDSYSSRSAAEAKAQELQQQGVNVEIKEIK
jgi:hypothetical protein